MPEDVEAMAEFVFRQYGWSAHYFVGDRVEDLKYAGDETGAIFWRAVGEAVREMQAVAKGSYTAKW